MAKYNLTVRSGQNVRARDLELKLNELSAHVQSAFGKLINPLAPALAHLEPVASLARRGWSALDRPDEPALRTYETGRAGLSKTLWWPALLGFVAATLIFLGASQPGSPFTYKAAGAWYFGIPTPNAANGQITQSSQMVLLGVLGVYAGIVMMVRAWYELVRVTTRMPGIPVSRLVPVFCAWVLPLLVVAPLFSKDAYSYAAQGEMMAHGINPYHYGPQVLGLTPFAGLVDPLWQNVSSPYGPMFLTFAGFIVSLGGHNELFSVVGMRFLALVGTVLFAVAVPVIARSFKRDGATAFVLVALNPLVLLHLVAGAHNDALMLGLMACGYALARRGHPVLGIMLCAFAASVKVPALVGAIYIGWEWLGSDKSPRERLRPLASAVVLAVVVMAAMSEVVGLGWGWISGLSNPDAVRSWLDPATGIALVCAHVINAVGLGDHTHLLITLWRGSGLLLAAVLALRFLIRSEQMGPLRAFGFTLIAAVMLGPVVQPWYLTWGFVILAPIAERRLRRIVMAASSVGCFLGLPGGRVLVREISNMNPIVFTVACLVLVALVVALVVPRLRKSPIELPDAALERV